VTPLLQMDKRKSNEEIAHNLLKDCENLPQEIPSTQPLSESGFNNSKSKLWGLSTKKFNESPKENKKRQLEEKEESPTKVRTIMNSEELNEPIEIKSTDTSIAIEEVRQSKDDSILEFNIFESKRVNSDSEDDDICISFTPEKKEFHSKSLHEEHEILSQKSNLSIQSSSSNHTKGNQQEDVCLSQELNIEEEEDLSQQSKCSVVIDDDLNQTLPEIEPEVEFPNSPTLQPDDDYFFTPEEEEKEPEFTPMNDLPLDSDTEINIDEDSIIQSKYDEKCSKLISEFKERVKELHKNMCSDIIQQKQQILFDYPKSIIYDFHIPSIFSFSPSLTLEVEQPILSSDHRIASEQRKNFTPASPQRKPDSPLITVEESQPPLMTQVISPPPQEEEMLQTQVSSQETKKKATATRKKTKKSSQKEVEMPDYDAMSIEELKKTLSKFGVKGGKKKYMVEKLIQIFKATHPTNE
jgi:hypothetical protein